MDTALKQNMFNTKKLHQHKVGMWNEHLDRDGSDDNRKRLTGVNANNLR